MYKNTHPHWARLGPIERKSWAECALRQSQVNLAFWGGLKKKYEALKHAAVEFYMAHAEERCEETQEEVKYWDRELLRALDEIGNS